jgi:hypothetical protein
MNTTPTDLPVPEDSDNSTVANLNVTNYLNSKKFSIENWFGFRSRLEEDCHPFKFAVRTNVEPGKETLCFTASDYPDNLGVLNIAFGEKRTMFKTRINLVLNTVLSPKGKLGDKEGDISIDNDFLYICNSDYNGDNIWKRIKLSDW